MAGDIGASQLAQSENPLPEYGRSTDGLAIAIRGDAQTAVDSSSAGRRTGPTRVITRLRKTSTRLGRVPLAAANTAGRAIYLAFKVLSSAAIDILTLRLPLQEFLWQAWVLLKVTAVPALLMAVPFGAMVTVVTSGLVAEVGATALLGAASGVGVVRQGAPMTAGLLMGGAAASAIASDFGARAMREELDALRVLGVDPVRRLVVPRFLAMLFIAPILCILIIAAGTGAAFLLSVVVNEVASGSFWSSFGTFAKMTDVWFALASIRGSTLLRSGQTDFAVLRWVGSVNPLVCPAFPVVSGSACSASGQTVAVAGGL